MLPIELDYILRNIYIISEDNVAYILLKKHEFSNSIFQIVYIPKIYGKEIDFKSRKVSNTKIIYE